MIHEKIAVVRATYPVFVDSADDGIRSFMVSTWFVEKTIRAAKRACKVETAEFEVLADPDAMPPPRRVPGSLFEFMGRLPGQQLSGASPGKHKT